MPASQKTEVNVESGDVGQVETETSTRLRHDHAKEVVSIGLNGRNFTQLIALAPGVSNQTGQDEAKVGVVGSVKYSVNGGRVEYNSFEVDGSDVLNTGLNGASSTLMVYPSLDAIQEVKVLTSNYGAQYGRTASGTVQVTTKSGSPKWHGNLYDFIRNEAFNSRNYFDVVYTTHAPPGQTVGDRPLAAKLRSIGGRISGARSAARSSFPAFSTPRRTRRSSFFSEEFRLEKTPIDYNQAVPGLKERGLPVILRSGTRSQKNLQNLPRRRRSFSRTSILATFARSNVGSELSRVRSIRTARASYQGTDSTPSPVTTLEGVGRPAGYFGVDKNANGHLELESHPLPNAPFRLQLQPGQFQRRSSP